MTNDDIYKIGEWLVYNQEELRAMIPKQDNDELMMDKVIFATSKFLPEYNLMQVSEAFDDPRIIKLYEFFFGVEKKEVH